MPPHRVGTPPPPQPAHHPQPHRAPPARGTPAAPTTPVVGGTGPSATPNVITAPAIAATAGATGTTDGDRLRVELMGVVDDPPADFDKMLASNAFIAWAETA